MTIYRDKGFGETRFAVTDSDGRVLRILTQRHLAFNQGEVIAGQVRAFHPTLHGYFVQTDKGDVFLPTSQSLCNGETVHVLIQKEPREEKTATGILTNSQPCQAPDLFASDKVTDIDSEQMDDWVTEALLPSITDRQGFRIHINKTKVCWTIDVDSAGFSGSLTDCNRLAINEIVRQIVLKNMAGVILIDFAGSKRGKIGTVLIQDLTTALKKHPDITCYGLTRSGLAELEKKRESAPVTEVHHPQNPLAVYYKIRRALDKCRSAKPTVYAMPEIGALIQRDGLAVAFQALTENLPNGFEIKEF